MHNTDFKNKISDKPPHNLIKYIQIYLIFTVIFYFIGPVQWNTQNIFLTFLLIFMYQLMLFLGYNFQMNIPVHSANNRFCSSQYVGSKFFWYALLSSIINLVMLVRITLLYGISSIIQTIILSFTDPTALYHAKAFTILSNEMFGGSAFAMLNAILSPITFSIIPVGIVLFPELKKSSKVMLVIAAILYVFTLISTGRSEGILKITIFLISSFLLVGSKRITSKRKNIKKRISTIILCVVCLIGFLFLYSQLMDNRTKGSYGLPIGSNIIDLDNGLLTIMPIGLQSLIVYLHIYLTQGYFGMSLSVGLPWKPTFFLGFSPWLAGEIGGILGIGIKERTFMERATQFGWRYGTNWHTAYTWFANDISWLGVIVLMFLIGRLLAGIYKDAYNNHNPVAIGMFSLLLMFIIYLPANNYLFADSDTIISFFVYLFLLRIRVKWNSSCT